MDQASSAIQAGTPPTAPPPSAPVAPSTWPIAAQIGLAFLVTAGLFFFLGRWSNEAAPAPAAPPEYAGPALDINLATRAELRLIPGLGDALAQRVFDERERRGAFKRVDDLRRVPGIGTKTLERIRPHVFVATPESFVSDDEEEAPAPKKSPATPRSTGTSLKAQLLKETISVNRAGLTELQKLPGIGPKLSQRILDERAKGPFKSVEELRRVPGIGPKTLEKLRPHVTIE